MKSCKRYSIAAKLVAALGVAAVFAAGIAFAATSTVNTTSAGPQPVAVTVQWGDSVTFANGDSVPHGIIFPSIAVNSPTIPAGESWTQVFDGRARSYVYRQTGTKNFTGSVVVQLTGKATIVATPTSVTYGKRVAFRGSALAGFPVLLEEQQVGQSGQWEEKAKVTAAADGVWSTSLVPTLGARYRATAAAGQLRSQAVTVGVAPAISLTAPRGPLSVKQKSVAVNATVVPPGSAVTADLERYDTQRRSWVRQDRRPVTRAGKVAFRWKTTKGRSQLRVQLHRFALKPGFAPATSKPVSVTVR